MAAPEIHASDPDSAPRCPYCGQLLLTEEAHRRLRESSELEPEEALDEEIQDGESRSEAAKRAHDLRVQTRIF